MSVFADQYQPVVAKTAPREKKPLKPKSGSHVDISKHPIVVALITSKISQKFHSNFALATIQGRSSSFLQTRPRSPKQDKWNAGNAPTEPELQPISPRSPKTPYFFPADHDLPGKKRYFCSYTLAAQMRESPVLVESPKPLVGKKRREPPPRPPRATGA
jgi:hypothetical protein